MKVKKLHPILYFSLLFIVLVAIQSYFLYNTVLLKKNEIKGKAQEIFEKSAVDYSFLEDTRWDESLYLWQNFESKEAAQKQFTAKMKVMNDSLAPLLQKFIKKKYKETGLKLAFKKELLGVYDKSHHQQIITKPITIYSTNPKPVANYLLSESKWESTYSSSTIISEKDTLNTKNLGDRIDIVRTYEKSVSNLTEHSYIIQQAIYYDILNMNTILFKELWGLFLVSVVLMILVLWLYYQSYKKYKEQRMQVLLLHDTIDNISHEFKTPLATLKIALKQMRFSKNEETLEIMDRQMLRLENLIKPLDDDFGNAEFVTENQVINLLKDIEILYSEINWNISVDLTDSLPMNLFELETILGNLIENSVKYGATSIHVSVHQEFKKVEIKVKDNGMGIAKNEHRKILDKYYRVATHNIHNVKGLGLGLYMVQKIVAKHQGTLTVNSTIGKGCEIIITL